MSTTDQKIDNLAASVAKGFSEMHDKFDAVDKRFDEVNQRLDRIESIILREHTNRLEKREDFMRQTKTALHIK